MWFLFTVSVTLRLSLTGYLRGDVAEESVLGSLEHTEARDVRFSVLDTADAAGCLGRAENGAGGPSGRLWPAAEGKRTEEGSSSWVPMGRRVLDLLGQLGLGWLAVS